MAARAPGRSALALEPALLDRRRALFDGDGAPRRERARPPLSYRRGGHQHAQPRAGRTGGVRKELLSRPGTGIPRPAFRRHAGAGFACGTTIRQQVRFQQGNLFAADFLPGRGDLRRHLLPKRAHLLRPPHAGSRARRAEPPAARQGHVVCRTRRDRAARESRPGLDEASRWPSRFARPTRVPPGRNARVAPSGQAACAGSACRAGRLRP